MEFFCGDEINFCPTGHMFDHALPENHLLCTRSDALTNVWCIERAKASGNTSVHSVRSMENLGNTCFYNSVLQILMSMDCFRVNFEKLEYQRDRPITNSLRSLFKEEIDHRVLFYSICSEIPMFQGCQEQDSQEFLLAFLNELLQEGTSCVDDIFQGVLSTTVLCSQCGHSSTVPTTFLDLSLSLPSTKRNNMLPANEENRFHDNEIASGSSVTKVFNGGICSSLENCCGQHPFICNKGSGEGADLLESQQKKVEDDPAAAAEEEDPEDCCGHHPCICNKDSGELHESQQKNPIEEVEEEEEEEEEEEDPEDCCGQHPCICNKDSGEVADLREREQEKVGDDTAAAAAAAAAEEEDPEDCCGQHPCICNKDSGELHELHESQQKKPIEEEDPEDCCRQHPCICNKDSGEVAGSPESRQKHQIKGEKDTDPEYEEQEERGGGEEEERDPDHISRAGIWSENNNGGTLSIERCLDLFTAPETIEYACDFCTVSKSKSKSDHLEYANARLGKGNSKSGTSDFQVDDRKVNATRRCLIFHAPSILVIHLKRCKQDAHGICKKIDSHVNFQEMLDLTPYVHHRGKEKFNYHLMGVVEHVGSSSATGHYVAYVREVRSEVEGGGPAWFKASDDIVQEVQLHEVLKSEAYILFFEKMQH